MGLFNPLNKSFCLEQLCEANYFKLLRLIPSLLSVEHYALGTARHKSAIQMRIVKRSPYTLTIELNHRFNQQSDQGIIPALHIRLYLDAKSAEVLSDSIRSEAYQALKSNSQKTAVMDYKWQLNYFLSKWLDHCLQADYHFQTQALSFA